jgi:hypothetical protein
MARHEDRGAGEGRSPTGLRRGGAFNVQRPTMCKRAWGTCFRWYGLRPTGSPLPLHGLTLVSPALFALRNSSHSFVGVPRLRPLANTRPPPTLPLFSLAPANHPRHIGRAGEVAEWSNAAVLKTAVGQPTVGSNPTLSAILRFRAGSFEWQANEKTREAKNALRSFSEEGPRRTPHVLSRVGKEELRMASQRKN